MSHLSTLIKLGIAGLLIVIFDKLIIGILFVNWIRTFAFLALLIYLVINSKLIIEKIKMIFNSFISNPTERKSYTTKATLSLPIILIDLNVLMHGFKVFSDLALLNKFLYVTPDFLLFSGCFYIWFNRSKFISNLKKATAFIVKEVLPKVSIIILIYCSLSSLGFDQVVASEEYIDVNSYSIEESLESSSETTLLSSNIIPQTETSIALTEDYFNLSGNYSIDLSLLCIISTLSMIVALLCFKKSQKFYRNKFY
ncbi:hypothetical protein AN643_02880 [Candidatus Epulonipiscioides saccharophilum]|nr:hypothetical protein AN643_02880 [Epulopiscium sp. SCG-B10WGA-EpuloB]